MKRVNTTVAAWRARFLLVLLALGAFIVPYVTGQIIEYSRIKQWEATGFLPDQTLSWWRHGIWRKSEAVRWRANGFSPEDAFAWKRMDFISQDAKEWKEAGFGVAGATEWRRYGFAPSDAAEWISSEFSIGDAVAWRKYGFGSLEAKEWRDLGHSPLTAADEETYRGLP